MLAKIFIVNYWDIAMEGSIRFGNSGEEFLYSYDWASKLPYILQEYCIIIMPNNYYIKLNIMVKGGPPS